MLLIETLKSELNEFAEKISIKFATFRVDFYASIIKKYIKNIKENNIGEPMSAKINHDNTYVFIPSEERLQVILGINFVYQTDNNLSKLFFRELDDSKFGTTGTIDVRYFNPSNNIPEEIPKILPDYKLYTSGFVYFSKFI